VISDTTSVQQPSDPALSADEPNLAGTTETVQRRLPMRTVFEAVGLLVASIAISLLVTELVARANGTSLLSPDQKSVAFGWAVAIGTLAQQFSLVALVWWAAGRKGLDRKSVLSLGPPRQGWKAYVVSFLALVAVVGIMSLTIKAIDPDIIKTDLAPFAEMMKLPSWWLTVIMVGVGAPLSEEFLFRGYLYSALAPSRLGTVGAAVITSASFAALHGYSLVGILQVFVVGLVFAAMLARTGSLRVTMFCHALYNTILIALLAVFGTAI
jgi:uncharacterized protein